MNKSNWKDIAELIGIAAIVASLLFVGMELKQNREIAIATAKDSTTEGWRELNFARMNADWYWEIASKLNDALDDPGPYILGIPLSTRDKWRSALDSLSPEEYGRFFSFHLQEKNEAERLYALQQLGMSPSGDNDGSYLASIRAPLWVAMSEKSGVKLADSSNFDRMILRHANGSER
jgi:hypothetical protein